MELVEKTLSSELKFDGRILKVKVDKVELPDGSVASREIVCHNGGACILPISKDGKVALVKQFRCPYKEIMYEIPAGKIDKGELPKDTAVRELFEEVGGRSNNIVSLGEIYPSPGYTNEKIYLYLALDVEYNQSCLDDGEFLDVEYFDFNELLAMIEDNTLKDSKTIISILRAKYMLKRFDN